MAYNLRFYLESVWVVVGLFWVLTAFRLKPVARRQGTGRRLIHVSILVLAAGLLFSEWPPADILRIQVLPDSASLRGAGLALAVAGALLAIAARAYLGRNWSGRPSIREDQQLVSHGPYAWVRHPIYTGLLLAAAGTALALGQTRQLLALPLALVGFWLKLREEERMLMQAFGNEYLAYRQSVKSGIIPFLL